MIYVDKDKALSIEQITHDLAVAYATYEISNMEETVDIEFFYQSYENCYSSLFPIVKRFN